MKKVWMMALAFALQMGAAHAQSELELAEFYFNEGSYEQAKLYLEKIWKKNKTQKVYDMYYTSLLAIDDFDLAEKLVKSRMRNQRTRATAYVELGQLYLHFDQKTEAKEAFAEALDRLEVGKGNAVSLANAFMNLNELDLALAVYEKAQALGTRDLDYQMVDLQGRRGNYPGMIDASVSLLHLKPTYLRNIQNSFSRNLRIQDNPELGELLRSKHLGAAREFPEDSIFPELLVWYFNQSKDFASAFIHAKSLDLRYNESGERLVELAQTASKNGDSETAAACYQFVASKGPDNPYFYTARCQSLRVLMSSLLDEKPFSIDGITQLAERYKSTLRDLGIRTETATLANELAHVEAFYLQDPTAAVTRLESVLKIPGLYNRTAAIAKLELGDVLVFNNEIWDASLLFSQVELDFKDDPLGHEAKFRNARISYFAGDFDWAQSQLDALKASTSKLISNDAIDLSLLITDNYAMDTIVEPMWLYAQADLLASQHRYDDARLKLDSLVTTWPGHALEDEVLMQLAEMSIAENQVDTAMTFLQEIVDLHFDDIVADDALFKLAQLHEEWFHNPEVALPLYEQLLFEFPGSLYAVEARRRFRLLRGEKD
jgi:tetratricopeptide (TPR) repeat protein